MMHSYGIGGHLGIPGLGILLQLFIFIGFLAITYWVVRSGNINKNTSPEEILKTRLAKGEITKKQYQELKKELEK